MKENHKAHLTKWSPAYIISAVLMGGGGTAALTDNFPITQAEMRVHESAPHATTSEAIDNTGDKLAAALAALAEAISLDALGDALAPSAHELAEQMLDDLGIDADGWRTAFRAAAGSL